MTTRVRGRQERTGQLGPEYRSIASNPPLPDPPEANDDEDEDSKLPRIITDLSGPDTFFFLYQMDNGPRLLVEVQECAKSVRLDARVFTETGTKALLLLRLVNRKRAQVLTTMMTNTPDGEFGVALHFDKRRISFLGRGVNIQGQVLKKEKFDRLWEAFRALPQSAS